MRDFRNGRISPYFTSYGRLIGTEKIVMQLNKYLAGNDIKLDYGFQTPGINFYIILGLNQEEEDLIIFNHPLFFTDFKGSTAIALDLRRFSKLELKKQKLAPDDMNNFTDYLKNMQDAKFDIIRALMSYSVLMDRHIEMRGSFKALMVTYASFVSFVINNIINLNVNERITVEVIASLYFYSNLTADRGFSHDDLKEIVSNQLDRAKLYIPIPKNKIMEILKNINPMNNFHDLINEIKKNIYIDKSNIIGVDAFNTLIGNTWVGPGGNELIYIALENIPTWITLFYYSLEDITYKKTRFMEMIKKFGLKSLGLNSKKEIDMLVLSMHPLIDFRLK